MPIPWFFNVVQGFCMIIYDLITHDYTLYGTVYDTYYHMSIPALRHQGQLGQKRVTSLVCGINSLASAGLAVSWIQRRCSKKKWGLQVQYNVHLISDILWETMNVKYHVMYMVHLISSNVYWCYGNYESMYNSMTINMTCTCMVLICTNTNINMK